MRYVEKRSFTILVITSFFSEIPDNQTIKNIVAHRLVLEIGIDLLGGHTTITPHTSYKIYILLIAFNEICKTFYDGIRRQTKPVQTKQNHTSFNKIAWYSVNKIVEFGILVHKSIFKNINCFCNLKVEKVLATPPQGSNCYNMVHYNCIIFCDQWHQPCCQFNIKAVYVIGHRDLELSIKCSWWHLWGVISGGRGCGQAPHHTLNQCWLNVGPASQTINPILNQHWVGVSYIIIDLVLIKHETLTRCWSNVGTTS